jgi:predicted amidohydrolase
VKVASAQILVLAGDQSGNLLRATDAIKSSKELGADFVVLPECSNFGWTNQSAITEARELSDDLFVKTIMEVAKRESIYVAVGFVERSGEKLFNSAVLINSEGYIVLHHRKINELDFARAIYSTGTETYTTVTEFGTIGLMICADALSKPDRVIQNLVEKGAQVILSPSAWAVPPQHDNIATPYGPLWFEAYRDGLAESNAWIVATSNVGVIAGGEWDGHPCIGNSIAMGPLEENLFISPFGAEAVHIKIIDIPNS